MTPADIEDTDATIERLTRERDEALNEAHNARGAHNSTINGKRLLNQELRSRIAKAEAQRDSEVAAAEAQLAAAEMHVAMLEALKPQEQWDARRAAEAQRDEALALLRECEWAGFIPLKYGEYMGKRCPSCRGEKPEHAEGCRLAKALRGGA